MNLPRFPLPHFSLVLSTAVPIAFSILGVALLAQNPLKQPGALPDRPLAFEANRGQTSADVQYLSRAAHYTAFLKNKEVTFVMRKARSDARSLQTSAPPPSIAPSSVTMTFAGANSKPLPLAQEELSSRSNYFIGHNKRSWQVGVPHYAQITYKALYHGIDLRYHGSHQALEYDFVVAPHADPGLIRMSFKGHSRLKLNPDGDIIVYGNKDELLLKSPDACQVRNGQKRVVESSFIQLPNDQLGIRVADYDRNAELVIDPKVVYSTYLGGTDDEGIFGIGFDPEGNIYVSGETSSVDFPSINAAQPSVGGNYDAFVSKLDPTGSRLIYSTYLGGGSYDHAIGIAVNDEGEAYLAGITQSVDFPTAHALQNSLGGPADAFVAKLDRTGSKLLFSTYLGGSGFDQASGLTIDNKGNVFVVGGSSSLDFPTTPHALQSQCGGAALTNFCSSDAFVAKIDRSGSRLVYSTYLGGSGYDSASAVAVDREGAAYIVGQSSSHDFPSKKAFQPALAGFANAFLTKFDPSGNKIVFSTYLGGNNFDAAEDVAVDKLHGIYITGFTGSQNFPVLHAFQSQHAGKLDGFITRFTPDGSKLVYSTFLGGSGNDFPFRIAVDAGRNASVAGFTSSADFPLKAPIQGTYNGGNSDVFVTRLSPSGSALSFSTYLGGSGDDYGYSIATTLTGALWVGGSTSSANLPTAHPYQAKFAGGPYDAFLTKIALDPKDALTVLRDAIQTLALEHSITRQEAAALEDGLDDAIRYAESGDHYNLRAALHSLVERIGEDRENQSLPARTASALQAAVLDVLNREDWLSDDEMITSN